MGSINKSIVKTERIEKAHSKAPAIIKISSLDNRLKMIGFNLHGHLDTLVFTRDLLCVHVICTMLFRMPYIYTDFRGLGEHVSEVTI